jgi:hypothetical protein
MKNGALPGELPHEVLPPQLQAKIAMRFDAPLNPRLYYRLIQDALRTLSGK